MGNKKIYWGGYYDNIMDAVWRVNEICNDLGIPHKNVLPDQNAMDKLQNNKETPDILNITKSESNEENSDSEKLHILNMKKSESSERNSDEEKLYTLSITKSESSERKLDNENMKEEDQKRKKDNLKDYQKRKPNFIHKNEKSFMQIPTSTKGKAESYHDSKLISIKELFKSDTEEEDEEKLEDKERKQKHYLEDYLRFRKAHHHKKENKFIHLSRKMTNQAEEREKKQYKPQIFKDEGHEEKQVKPQTFRIIDEYARAKNKKRKRKDDLLSFQENTKGYPPKTLRISESCERDFEDIAKVKQEDIEEGRHAIKVKKKTSSSIEEIIDPPNDTEVLYNEITEDFIEINDEN